MSSYSKINLGEKGMKITIDLFGDKKQVKIFLDDNKRIFLMNGEKRESADIDEFASRLLRIVSRWKEKYYDPFSLNFQGYDIDIEKDNKVYSYTARGILPNNFSDFSKLIESLSEII